MLNPTTGSARAQYSNGLVEGMLRVIDVANKMQPRTNSGDAGEDQDVSIAPDKPALAMDRENLTARQREVLPPQRKRQGNTDRDHGDGVEAPAVVLSNHASGRQGSEHGLAQRDDHEAGVTLSNVVCVPRSRSAAVACPFSLREHRTHHFHAPQDRADSDRLPNAERQDRQGNPSHLGERDEEDIRQCCVRYFGSRAARNHCAIMATRMTTYPATITLLLKVPSSSIDSNISGSPIARMMTPTICTIVVTRKSQSSVSNADANQVKLIHAHTMANIAKAKARMAGPA